MRSLKICLMLSVMIFIQGHHINNKDSKEIENIVSDFRNRPIKQLEY